MLKKFKKKMTQVKKEIDKIPKNIAKKNKKKNKNKQNNPNAARDKHTQSNFSTKFNHCATSSKKKHRKTGSARQKPNATQFNSHRSPTGYFSTVHKSKSGVDAQINNNQIQNTLYPQSTLPIETRNGHQTGLSRHRAHHEQATDGQTPVRSIFPVLDCFGQSELVLPHSKSPEDAQLKVVTKQCVVLLLLNAKLRLVKRKYLAERAGDRFQPECFSCRLDACRIKCCELGASFRQPYKWVKNRIGKLDVDAFAAQSKEFPDLLADKHMEFLWFFFINRKCGQSFHKAFAAELEKCFDRAKVKGDIKRYIALKPGKAQSSRTRRPVREQIEAVIAQNGAAPKKVKNHYKRVFKFVYWTMCSILKQYFHKTVLACPTRLRYLDPFFELENEQHKVFVIDCRRRLEFEGGHVKDALNINDPRVVAKLFFSRRVSDYDAFFAFLERYKNCRVDSECADQIVGLYRQQEKQSPGGQPALSNDALRLDPRESDSPGCLGQSEYGAGLSDSPGSNLVRTERGLFDRFDLANTTTLTFDQFKQQHRVNPQNSSNSNTGKFTFDNLAQGRSSDFQFKKYVGRLTESPNQRVSQHPPQVLFLGRATATAATTSAQENP